MDEEKYKAIAQQLRKPQGEHAKQVGENMNKGNLFINQYAIEALQVSPQDNILEIGMGNGFFVKDILSRDLSVKYSGCDYAEAMVEEACKLNSQFIQNGQAQFILASAEELPFGNETFDKAFTINTLYFWKNPEVVLADIKRVLKPQGKLIVAIRPKSTMQAYPFVKYGFNMFSKERLVDLLEQNGYVVEESLEKVEPDQEMNGEKLIVESLIVRAHR